MVQLVDFNGEKSITGGRHTLVIGCYPRLLGPFLRTKQLSV